MCGAGETGWTGGWVILVAWEEGWEIWTGLEDASSAKEKLASYNSDENFTIDETHA